MTDKEQIIIDGVDVSGCELYSKYREKYCEWHLPCQGQSCSYKLDWALKQLAHKTQECGELAKERDYFRQIVEGCPDIACENGGFCAIDAENKRLKQERRELEIKNVTLQNRYQQVAGATTEAACYRKALEEIEEIANEPCVADALDDCKSCNIYCEHKDILNIINKAKGTDNGLS